MSNHFGKKLSDLTSAQSLDDDDLVYVVRGKDDRKMTAAKLREALSFLGNAPAGNLSALNKTGRYFGTAASDYPDAPSAGLNPGNSFWVENIDVTGEGRYFFQRITRYPNMDRVWVRRSDAVGASSTAWIRLDVPAAGSVTAPTIADGAVTTEKLADGAVTAEKLHSGYQYRALLTEGSLNDTDYPTGTYLVTNGVSDRPSPLTGNAVMIVDRAQSWAVHRIISISNPDERYVRTTRFNNGEFQPWNREAAQTSPFAGKKVVCLGDSITANYGLPPLIASRLGCDVTNFGIGGTRMATHTADGYDKLSGFQIAQAIASGDWTDVLDGATEVGTQYIIDRMTEASQLDWSTVDYIVVGYGTNDFGGNRVVGTSADTDGMTFCGAINVTIESILSAYPRIRLFFWSPIWRRRTPTDPDGIAGGSDVSPNTIGSYLYEYVEAMQDACKRKHQPFVDLYYTSGIYETTHLEYLTDELHPTPEGAELIAGKIAGAMRTHFG